MRNPESVHLDQVDQGIDDFVVIPGPAPIQQFRKSCIITRCIGQDLDQFDLEGRCFVLG